MQRVGSEALKEKHTRMEFTKKKRKEERKKKNRQKCVARLANFFLNVFTARHEKQKEKKKGKDGIAQQR